MHKQDPSVHLNVSRDAVSWLLDTTPALGSLGKWILTIVAILPLANVGRRHLRAGSVHAEKIVIWNAVAHPRIAD